MCKLSAWSRNQTDCLKPLAPLDSYAEPSHPFWLWGGKSSQFGKVIEQWPRNGKAGQRQRVCFQTCFGALKNSSMYRIVPSIIQTNGTVPPLVDLMISCINCQVEQLETVNKLQMPWSKQSMPWIGGTSPIFGWGNKYLLIVIIPYVSMKYPNIIYPHVSHVFKFHPHFSC